VPLGFEGFKRVLQYAVDNASVNGTQRSLVVAPGDVAAACDGLSRYGGNAKRPVLHEAPEKEELAMS
jgi:hypothetical protein